jgi:hypothetical protein
MAYLINEYNLKVTSIRGDITAFIDDVDLPFDNSIVLNLLKLMPRDTKLFYDRLNTNLNSSLSVEITENKGIFVVFKGTELFTTMELDGSKTIGVDDLIGFIDDTLLGEE